MSYIKTKKISLLLGLCTLSVLLTPAVTQAQAGKTMMLAQSDTGSIAASQAKEQRERMAKKAAERKARKAAEAAAKAAAKEKAAAEAQAAPEAPQE